MPNDAKTRISAVSLRFVVTSSENRGFGAGAALAQRRSSRFRSGHPQRAGRGRINLRLRASSFSTHPRHGARPRARCSNRYRCLARNSPKLGSKNGPEIWAPKRRRQQGPPLSNIILLCMTTKLHPDWWREASCLHPFTRR